MRRQVRDGFGERNYGYKKEPVKLNQGREWEHGRQATRRTPLESVSM